MENGNLIKEAVHGYVGTNPEMSVTTNGSSRVTFRLGIAQRVQTADGEWMNTDPHFITVSMFGRSAERTFESIRKGDHVIALGNVREYEVNDPETGPGVRSEFRAARVGHDLNMSTVEVQRRAPGAQSGANAATSPRVAERVEVSAQQPPAAQQSAPVQAQIASAAQNAWGRVAANHGVAVPPPPQAGGGGGMGI